MSSRAQQVAMRGHIDVLRYFPHALLATSVVFGVPGGGILAWTLIKGSPPPTLAMVAVSLIVSGLLSVVGSSMWVKNPASARLSFGDLMLWNWWRIKRAEDRLMRGTRRLGLLRDGQPAREISLSHAEQLKILHDLSAALEAKDPYTHGHSRRVARHAYRTAAAMGLASHDLEIIRTAAELHDVGKVRIPDSVLRKPGKLTDDEYELVKEHSVVGAYMVANVGDLDVIEAVRHHHERWDGMGYPDNLAGTQIPLFARILAVADTYDAITSSRPYREKSERQRALNIIEEESGRQFDPQVVEAFLSSLPVPTPVMAGLAALTPGFLTTLRKSATAARKMGSASVLETVRATGLSVAISAAVVAPAASGIEPYHSDHIEVSAGSQDEDISDVVTDRDSNALDLDLLVLGVEGEPNAFDFGSRTLLAQILDPSGSIDFEPTLIAEAGDGTAGPTTTDDGSASSPESGGPSSGGASANPGPPSDPGNGTGKPADVGPPAAPGKPADAGPPADAGKPPGAGNGGGKPADPGPPANPGNGGGKPADPGPPANPGNGGGKPADPGPPANPGNGGGKPADPGTGGSKPADPDPAPSPSPGDGNDNGGGKPADPGPPADPGNDNGNSGGNTNGGGKPEDPGPPSAPGGGGKP